MSGREALLRAVDRAAWVRSIGVDPHEWQHELLEAEGDVAVAAGRQVGKSTGTGWVASHSARHYSDLLALMLSTSQRQSSFLLARAAAALKRDPTAPRIVSDTASTLKLANGSQIVSLPGSEAAARGYSADVLVVDEAARVEETLWAAVEPTTLATGGRRIYLSTPAGQRGRFWRIWSGARAEDDQTAELEAGRRWTRITARSGDVLDAARVAEMRRDLGPRLAAQELDASFDEAGDALFAEERLRQESSGVVGQGGRIWEMGASARHAARLKAQSVEAVDRDVVYARDRGICGICGGHVDRLHFSVDHVVPLAAGGEDSYANVQLAHILCNRRKTSTQAAP